MSKQLKRMGRKKKKQKSQLHSNKIYFDTESTIKSLTFFKWKLSENCCFSLPIFVKFCKICGWLNNVSKNMKFEIHLKPIRIELFEFLMK